LFLELGSESVTLSPNFEFELEVSETLSDQFNVQDARHALLRLAKRLKLVLKGNNIDFGVVTWAVSARAEATLPHAGILVIFIF